MCKYEYRYEYMYIYVQQQYKCKCKKFCFKSENTQDLHVIFMATKTCTHNIGLYMVNLIFLFPKMANNLQKYK